MSPTPDDGADGFDPDRDRTTDTDPTSGAQTDVGGGR